MSFMYKKSVKVTWTGVRSPLRAATTKYITYHSYTVIITYYSYTVFIVCTYNIIHYTITAYNNYINCFC